MKAIVLNTKTGKLQLDEYPEPSIQHEKEIKLKVLEVGICGTDRDEVKRAGEVESNPGKETIIIGHEMLGQVVEVGKAVTQVELGDLAAFTVRRGCGKCPACLKNRSDMCYTGDYTERGIKKRDGYQAEFVVDHEDFVIPVPSEMRTFGVLSEPMSVIEKALDEMDRIQSSRLVDWLPNRFKGKKVLVAGLGPIGLLASLGLRLREAEVWGLDIVDANSPRPQMLKQIGGCYLDGRQTPAQHIPSEYGKMDLIVEAAGIVSLDFNLWDILGPNAICALTGVTDADKWLEVDGGKLMRQLVLNNQVLVGSVNASTDHWKMGVKDLQDAHRKWGDVVSQFVTHRFSYQDFEEGILKHPENEIKTVIAWDLQ